MSAATQATPQSDPSPPAQDTPYYRVILHGMIDRGADLTRVLHELAIAHAAQQATVLAQQAAASAQHTAAPASQPADASPAPAPAPAPPPSPDALIRTAATFDQIARGVRRSIMLAQNLDAPKRQASHPAPDRTDDRTDDRTAARKRILRAVEDVIQRPPDNPECDDAEVLLADFRERMDTPDLDDDIKNRPVADIIKEICRDLGLAALPGTHPWKRRTPADIAELNARAAAPSRPTWTAGRQPGAGPHDSKPGSVQPAPTSQEDRRGPAERAATQPSPKPTDPREPGQPQPGQPQPSHPASAAQPPVHPGNTLPQDPAEAAPVILHNHARTDARSHPPPDD